MMNSICTFKCVSVMARSTTSCWFLPPFLFFLQDKDRESINKIQSLENKIKSTKEASLAQHLGFPNFLVPELTISFPNKQF